MGLWSFSKKREPGDIAEAKLLEKLEQFIKLILSNINSYIEEYQVHKASYMKKIHKAISLKEEVIELIRSSNTATKITNPSHRSQNRDLINEIEGIFSTLPTPLNDIVTIEQANYMKKKCEKVSDKIKGLLRNI